MSKKYENKTKPLHNYLKKIEGLHKFESDGFDKKAIALFDEKYGDRLKNKLEDYFKEKSIKYYKPVSYDDVEKEFGELIKAIKEDIFKDFTPLWLALDNSNIHADTLKSWQKFLTLKIKRNLDVAFAEMWKIFLTDYRVFSMEYYAKGTDCEGLAIDLNNLGF